MFSIFNFLFLVSTTFAFNPTLLDPHPRPDTNVDSSSKAWAEGCAGRFAKLRHFKIPDRANSHPGADKSVAAFDSRLRPLLNQHSIRHQGHSLDNPKYLKYLTSETLLRLPAMATVFKFAHNSKDPAVIKLRTQYTTVNRNQALKDSDPDLHLRTLDQIMDMLIVKILDWKPVFEDTHPLRTPNPLAANQSLDDVVRMHMQRLYDYAQIRAYVLHAEGAD